MDLIKFKTFFFPKDIINNLRKQAADQEKVFAIQIPSKELVPRIYKEHSKISKNNKQCKNGQRIKETLY